MESKSSMILESIPLNPEAIRVEDLPLKQGWNHFMVKVVQGGGDWLFAGRFETTENDPNKEFVKKLKADLVNSGSVKSTYSNRMNQLIII